METKEKARGCLLGGAAGDALGYPVEFCDNEAIEKHYGPLGIREFDLLNGVAIVSDDTQMTMFTAEGILREPSIRSIREAYKDWYFTQLNRPQYAITRSKLLQNPEMYAIRAPGNTCLTAIQKGCDGTLDYRINGSKGCGGAMRVAPIGVLIKSPAEAATLAAEAAALTHGHDYGILPAGVLGCIISTLLNYPDDKISRIVLADRIKESLCVCDGVFNEFLSYKDLRKMILKAVDLGMSNELVSVDIFGRGWVAEETICIAIFCAVRYTFRFREALAAAVNHSGDSDSTGAVTGNILGAFIGDKKIPTNFKRPLQFRAELIDFADRLAEKR